MARSPSQGMKQFQRRDFGLTRHYKKSCSTESSVFLHGCGLQILPTWKKLPPGAELQLRDSAATASSQSCTPKPINGM
ncbi:hypothetical protein FQN60_003397 [Etheostoma spectabile]|uniref:Uncharacterized protein n=1 Tax=Etheostoma spectabile TaxID=54343 RepID=A0A5J5CMF2_9PERO|nr:hypothetical protein FQN60_003397 [Etheostoma spectabile]